MRSAELFGESDEHVFRPANVTKSIRIQILDDFTYEPCAVLPKSLKRIVNIVYREHDAEVTEGIHGSLAVIRDNSRREKTGEFQPAVAVRRPHHGNLYALIAEACDASGPRPFDQTFAFEFEAEFPEEVDHRAQVFNDDADVVHPFKRHGSQYILYATPLTSAAPERL